MTKVGHRAAVVCTSGTAVANLHPAVLEAAHAGLPLVVVTADRPASLRGTGASQTTDQVRIFGEMADFLDVALEPGDRLLHRLDEVAAAVEEFLAPGAAAVRPGPFGAGAGQPVHLNVQLVPPLVPDVPRHHRRAGARPSRSAPSGPTRCPPRRCRSAPAPSWSPATTPARRRGCSPSRPAGRCSPSRPAGRAPAPTRSAATGCCSTVRWAARSSGSWSAATPPSPGRSPRCSAATTSRWSRCRRAAAGPSGRSPSTGPCPAVAVDGSDDPAWLERWRAADAEVSRGLDRLLAAEDGLTPHEVAGAVSRAVPPSGLLLVGASSPIRDLDLMVAPYAVGDRRRVIANRGLAGIDGTVSTAIGAALARPHGARNLALMGDVTFLHDATGLVIGPDEPRPDLTIVVVNDDGGSIFAMLEQGAEPYADRYDRLFGTPHGVDLASLCAATRTAALEGRLAARARAGAGLAQRRHRGRRGGGTPRQPARARRPDPRARRRATAGRAAADAHRRPWAGTATARSVTLDAPPTAPPAASPGGQLRPPVVDEGRPSPSLADQPAHLPAVGIEARRGGLAPMPSSARAGVPARRTASPGTGPPRGTAPAAVEDARLIAGSAPSGRSCRLVAIIIALATGARQDRSSPPAPTAAG